MNNKTGLYVIMILQQARYIRTDTLFPYTTLCRTIGNGAYRQLQLDGLGERLEAVQGGGKFLRQPSHEGWNFQKVMLEDLKKQWRLPDQGIWEIRGPPR